MVFSMPNRFLEDNQQQLVEFELMARNNTLKKLLRHIYRNYCLQKKQYDLNIESFICDNHEIIDNYRARLMLNMDSCKLERI